EDARRPAPGRRGRRTGRRPALKAAGAIAGGALGLALLAGCGGAADVPLDKVDVRVVSRGTSWSVEWVHPARPGAGASGAASREVHAPAGAEVRMTLVSEDYITTFAVPGLGLRDFAAPGVPGELAFHAGREGRFEMKADEMCGVPGRAHERGLVVVEDADAYRAWVAGR
ncbi:MAG TPA: hypothetical protein VHF22_15395, partial [Planctomycetota bacterium]|nr:hypothetical protein [Planctomycetota bacterium]